MKAYKICNDSGEDKSCSDGFAPNFNPKDHTFYWVNTDSSVCWVETICTMIEYLFDT